jgi:hypothetical protein
MRDDFLPDDLRDLERRLIARGRPFAPTGLRARVLASFSDSPNIPARAFVKNARRAAMVAAGALIAVGFCLGVAESAASVPSHGGFDRREVIAATRRLESLGISPDESRRGALMIYLDATLPRLIIPQRVVQSKSDTDRLSF